MITPVALALLLATAPAEPARGFPDRWDVQLDLVDVLFCCSYPVFKPLTGIGLSGQATWKLTSWGLVAGARQHVLYDYAPLMLRFATEAEVGIATSHSQRWQVMGGLLAGVKWGVAGGRWSYLNGSVVEPYWGWAARPSVRLTAGARFFITPRVGIVAQVFFPVLEPLADLADNDSTLLSIGVTWI